MPFYPKPPKNFRRGSYPTFLGKSNSPRKFMTSEQFLKSLKSKGYSVGSMSDDMSISLEANEEPNEIINTVDDGPIPSELISQFVNALRESLRGDKRDNNFFRFVLQNNKKAVLEKSKAYFPKLGVVGLLAIQRVIDKYYTVHETYQDAWEDIEPASEIEVTVGYEQEVVCFEYGIIELVNKKTKEHLVLFVNTETQSPYYKVYSIAGTGESQKFLKRVETSIKKNNLYKNKTFTVEKSYNVGMIPKFLKTSTVSHEEVIIPDEINTILQANVIDIFEKAEEYRNAKIPLKRGILLEGPPGNGKSTIIKYLESRLAGMVTFIYVTDGAIGGASDIAEIYKLAREYAPTIVVLEDIDTIGLTRERGSNAFTSELLGQLDGLEALEGVVTMATTNHSDLIDDALKNRPSRFDRRIQIALPDENLRAAMWSKFLKEKNVDEENINIKTLAKETKDFSGAMIKEVVITAKMLVVQESLASVSQEILVRAIAVIRETFHDSKIAKKNQEAFGFRSKA